MQDFIFHSPDIASETLKIYDVRQKPFSIHGLYQPEEKGLFRRMPNDVAKRTNDNAILLYTNTAGGRIRFTTDSDIIAIGAKYPPMTFSSARTAAFCGAGAFCFDLYADGKHERVMWQENVVQNGSVVSFHIPDGQYEAIATFPDRKTREITLCFPSFVNITEVYIGLSEDALLSAATPYKNEKPVVFYGSSITQGACASRAGNTYPNILSRKFGFDYINLGFASACHAEDAIIKYIATLPMSMLVFDYDHNAPNAEFLESTHWPALKKLREALPEVPFILLSKPNQHSGENEAVRRMEVIRKSYEALLKYPAPVHFVNGQEIFSLCDSEMMTVDTTHPTDLGFYCMAEALSDIFSIYF